MSRDDPGTSWFLAQLKPNSHNIAVRKLTQQGFRTFLPLQEETRRARTKFVTRLRPLFPGYVFVALDVAQGGWRAVNGTQGITRLVSFGGDPAEVPRELVDQLMGRCDPDGRLKPPQSLSAGDKVALTGGPFTDFVGTIEQIAPDRRVYVLLDLLGGQTRIAVKAEHIRAA